MSRIKIIVKIYGLLSLILCSLQILLTKFNNLEYFNIVDQISDMELDLRIMKWRDDIIALEPQLESFTLSNLILVSKGDFELSDFGLEDRDIEFNLSESYYTFSKVLGNIINIKVLLKDNELISIEVYEYEMNQLIFLSKKLKDLTKE